MFVVEKNEKTKQTQWTTDSNMWAKTWVVAKWADNHEGPLWVWMLTRCFPPVVGSSSDIVIPGVAPLNQCLHYSEEIQAWKTDSRTEWCYHGGFSASCKCTVEDLAFVRGSSVSFLWLLPEGLLFCDPHWMIPDILIPQLRYQASLTAHMMAEWGNRWHPVCCQSSKSLRVSLYQHNQTPVVYGAGQPWGTGTRCGPAQAAVTTFQNLRKSFGGRWETSWTNCPQPRQNCPLLELTHIAFAWVQILQRVSLAKPGDADVDAWRGRAGPRVFVIDQPTASVRRNSSVLAVQQRHSENILQDDSFPYSAALLPHLWRNYFRVSILSFGCESTCLS